MGHESLLPSRAMTNGITQVATVDYLPAMLDAVNYEDEPLWQTYFLHAGIRPNEPVNVSHQLYSVLANCLYLRRKAPKDLLSPEQVRAPAAFPFVQVMPVSAACHEGSRPTTMMHGRMSHLEHSPRKQSLTANRLNIHCCCCPAGCYAREYGILPSGSHSLDAPNGGLLGLCWNTRPSSTMILSSSASSCT